MLGPGEKLLASQNDIGDSYEAAEELRKRHEEMEIKCTVSEFVIYSRVLDQLSHGLFLLWVESSSTFCFYPTLFRNVLLHMVPISICFDAMFCLSSLFISNDCLMFLL